MAKARFVVSNLQVEVHVGDLVAAWFKREIWGGAGFDWMSVLAAGERIEDVEVITVERKGVRRG